ncbi:MAG: rRNA maturation RNase YbeY [Rhodospirillaceae bacterium]|nr:rRNA maturation RNase YbeY [Rhodospirillaceae bacterium]MBT5374879.1 rRNA maturation RNase YbeY [Rhodospirillaceae bacterium]MBT5751413.1 rRNA maturation RNase YbeY [Rhodospirillaceae bacterium]
MNSLPSRVPEAEIFVEISCPQWRQSLADPDALCRKAILAALEAVWKTRGAQSSVLQGESKAVYEISLVLADDAFLRRLNRDFAGKDKATNVLAFVAGEDEGATSLGDVAIAYETVAREAVEHDKTVEDHLAHLVVHGMLHLLGYDHDSDASALTMETQEVLILSHLGIGDPYDAAE